MVKNKWEQLGLPKGATERKAQGNFGTGTVNIGTGTYMPRYARAPAKFTPKRVVKSFRDLEVYQKTLECSVIVGKNILPGLIKQKFPLCDGMRDCSLSIPLFVAESHGMRFSNFEHAVETLERAMQGCNKMIVYLEQAVGLCETVDKTLVDDLSGRYLIVRGKMLRLEHSWQKFRTTSGNTQWER